MLYKTILISVSLLVCGVISTEFNDLDYFELLSRCQEPRCVKSREYSAILGRASWTFLHTMSVNYPDEPSAKDKTDIMDFLHLFGRFYPCLVCSENFAKELEMLPPRVDSRHDFAIWMCELHNSVNQRLGKPQFDCETVFQVWQRDPADGYCPDVCPVNFDSDVTEGPEEAHTYIAME